MCLLFAVGAAASPFNTFLRFKFFIDGYRWRGFNREDSIPLGKTLALSGGHYKYTFDALANTMLAFADALQLKRYALYVFDYGAPTGFRLAMVRPERIAAIVRRTGMLMKKAWGTHGIQFGAIGTIHLPKIAKPCARL